MIEEELKPRKFEVSSRAIDVLAALNRSMMRSTGSLTGMSANDVHMSQLGGGHELTTFKSRSLFTSWADVLGADGCRAGNLAFLAADFIRTCVVPIAEHRRVCLWEEWAKSGPTIEG